MQSVKRLTLCFDSGHDLRVLRSSSTLGSARSLFEFLSPSPVGSPPALCVCVCVCEREREGKNERDLK